MFEKEKEKKHNQVTITKTVTTFIKKKFKKLNRKDIGQQQALRHFNMYPRRRLNWYGRLCERWFRYFPGWLLDAM